MSFFVSLSLSALALSPCLALRPGSEKNLLCISLSVSESVSCYDSLCLFSLSLFFPSLPQQSKLFPLKYKLNGRVCTCVVSAAVLPGHRVPLLQLQAVHRLRPARVLHLLHTLHDSVRYLALLALVIYRTNYIDP